MPVRDSRILILCKTYPSPSAKYAETSCVAGMQADGSLIRLYPVPFRLIKDEAQFKKWQWVNAKINRANDDRRPESHRLLVDTIRCDASPLPTKHNWSQRREWLRKIETVGDFDTLELLRQEKGSTLGIVRPARILGLDITPVAAPQWSSDEHQKLVQMQRQAGLFDDAEAKEIKTLRKLPFDFHYRYECRVGDTTKVHRHKIVDWEAGALFWNVHRRHGADWERPFRDMMEHKLPSNDLMFLMGTIHRFPDQWLIVSLIYPPKESTSVQSSLFC